MGASPHAAGARPCRQRHEATCRRQPAGNDWQDGIGNVCTWRRRPETIPATHDIRHAGAWDPAAEGEPGIFDDDVVEHLRSQADAEGVGYQKLINAVLRKAAVDARTSKPAANPLKVATLRRVLREVRRTP